MVLVLVLLVLVVDHVRISSNCIAISSIAIAICNIAMLIWSSYDLKGGPYRDMTICILQMAGTHIIVPLQ